MPGDFIAESLLRGLLETLFYGLFYYTGACSLWMVAFGRVKPAPLGTLWEENKGKRRTGRGIWLHRPGRGRALKADYVCLAGVLVWILIGCSLYFASRGSQEPSGDGTAPPPAAIHP